MQKIINPVLVTKGDVESEPISLQELKSQLRITHDDEDDYLIFLISAAREALELATQRSFAVADMVAVFEDSCGHQSYRLRLPHPPFVGPAKIQDVVVAVSRDSAGASISSDVIGTTPFPLEVTYKAGGCTQLGKICVLMWAAHLYESRQPVGDKVSEMPLSLASFVERLRVINV